MEDQKKTIIIDEIKQWRKNKLLPESYCIFLLNLYSEGELTQSTPTIEKPNRIPFALSFKSIRNILMIVTILLVGINFNSFSQPLQIGIFVFILLFLYVAGYYLQRKSFLISQLFLGLASTGVLFSSSIIFSLEDPDRIMLFLLMACILWVVTGLTSIATFLISCGFIGFLLIYGWFIHDEIVNSSIAIAQLYWLPESMLFLWLFLMTSNKRLKFTYSLGIVALMMWIAPEIHFIVVDGFRSYVLQGIFVVKIICLSVAFFWAFQRLRNSRTIGLSR